MTDLEKVVRSCQSSFWLAGFFSLVVNILMLTPSIYMLQVYDRVITSGSKPTLLMLTLIMAMMLVTIGALEWVRSRILVRVSTRIDYLLAGRLYALSFQSALQSPRSGLSAQPLNDLTGLRQFLTGTGLFAFFDAPWIPIYIAVMFVFHPWMGWVGVAAAIVLSLLAWLNERSTSRVLDEANQQYRSGVGSTVKNLRNAEVVAAMGMLPGLHRRWEQLHHGVLALQGKASDRAGVWQSLSKTLRLLVQSLILGLGAYLVLEQQITPGLMIAGSILLGRALAPIDQMIGVWKQFVSARGQYGRLNQLLKASPEESAGMALPAPSGEVAAEQAFVCAPGQAEPIIRELSFRVVAGESVGIVGPSASGKSTLARALIGIWPAVKGNIRLDDADISGWNRAELGPYIGYLPQDIELFDGTIAENIARFGDIDPVAVVEAAQLAGVHEMILRLPEGYDTVTGADGGILSGGQRQRVGLARAVYRNPRLVVLDEPNSNLDDTGDQALSIALTRLKQQGVTTFVISHRINALSQMDKLMVLNEGSLVLFGNRNDVLQRLQSLPRTSQAAAAQVRETDSVKE